MASAARDAAMPSRPTSITEAPAPARTAGRGFAALKALLGSGVIGFVTSDRWAVYDKWPVEQRQVCERR